MAGTLEFSWTGAIGSERVRAAATRALASLQPGAQTVWNGIVPVKTGFLRDSWFSFITTQGTTLMLVFGATAFYAIFVELGTVFMAPRYPLRRTAQAVAPMVMPRLLAELASGGGSDSGSPSGGGTTPSAPDSTPRMNLRSARRRGRARRPT